MFAPKSTHKRKRSSARRDAANEGISAGHSIISVVRSNNSDGKKSEDEKEIFAGEDRVGKILDSHIINHKIHILFPLPEKTSINHISNCILDGKSIKSYVTRISPKLFLDPLFLVSYLKRGQLRILSVGELDHNDMICIDGKGKLHLSLTKETYQTLGLQGQALKSSKTSSGKTADRKSGPAERYVVTINLIASSFEPGKPGYERVQSRFDHWDRNRGDGEHKGSWDVLMSWCSDENPFGGTIEFPSKYVTRDCIKQLPIDVRLEEVDDVWVPKQTTLTDLSRGWSAMKNSDDRLDWSGWYELLAEQMEWSSFNLLGCDCVRTFWRADQMNVCAKGEPHYQSSKVVKVSYTGFLPPTLGKTLVNEIQNLLKKKLDQKVHFAVVQATGFADMPVCWSSKRSIPTNATTPLSTLFNSLQGDVSTDEESEEDSGKRARRKRNKSRQKRGYTNPNQYGHQDRNEHSTANTSGWQVILFGQDEGKHNTFPNCIVIENIGDSQRS